MTKATRAAGALRRYVGFLQAGRAKVSWLLDRDEDDIPSALQREIRQDLINLLAKDG